MTTIKVLFTAMLLMKLAAGMLVTATMVPPGPARSWLWAVMAAVLVFLVVRLWLWNPDDRRRSW